MSAEELFLTRYKRYQSNLRFIIFLAGAALTIFCSFLGTSTQAVSVFIIF